MARLFSHLPPGKAIVERDLFGVKIRAKNQRQPSATLNESPVDVLVVVYHHTITAPAGPRVPPSQMNPHTRVVLICRPSAYKQVPRHGTTTNIAPESRVASLFVSCPGRILVLRKNHSILAFTHTNTSR